MSGIRGVRCQIIAEAGVNHDGRLDGALLLVDVAAECGADMVKFQTFRADTLVTRAAPKAGYQQAATGAREPQHAMLKALELSPDDHRRLFDRCAERGVVFLSTPYCEASVDALIALGVEALKIASADIVHHPLLRHAARTRLPLYLSTGMATLAEIEAAVSLVQRESDAPLTLLHCVTEYPAPARAVNLRALDTLRAAFGAPVGYSDHTEGIAVALAAASRGAVVIEKHFTLDRSAAGPDHRASLDPDDLRALVAGVRAVESALGDGRIRPAPGELANAAAMRRSLVLTRDLPAGTVLLPEHLCAKRPGNGFPPSRLDEVLGRTLRIALGEDRVLLPEHLG